MYILPRWLVFICIIPEMPTAPILSEVFRFLHTHYDNIELSSDFLGDLIIYFLIHFISRLLVEPDDFPVAVIKRRLSLATF